MTLAKPEGAFYIRLDAGHDVNGNARRVFVVFSCDAKIIATLDEGSKGDYDVRKYHPSARKGGSFPTTPKTYRNLVKGDFLPYL